MKKIFIGSLVGAVILFVWSFVAWALSPMHLHTFMYTPAQEAVLRILAENNTESGAYYLPMADNRGVTGMDHAYQEASQKVMTENAGKPSATIFYLKEGVPMSMGFLVRGFFIDLIAVLAAVILLAPAYAASPTFFGRWWLSLMVGLLISAASPLIEFNYMGFPWSYTLDIITDIFVNWGLVGLWLAWYFRK